MLGVFIVTIAKKDEEAEEDGEDEEDEEAEEMLLRPRTTKGKEQLIEDIIKSAGYHTPWIYTTARIYPETLQPKLEATTFTIATQLMAR